jgi:hypothetical protein
MIEGREEEKKERKLYRSMKDRREAREVEGWKRKGDRRSRKDMREAREVEGEKRKRDTKSGKGRRGEGGKRKEAKEKVMGRVVKKMSKMLRRR